MERLLLFPQPFADETLYSLVVRYHKLSANGSYRRTSQDLFGAYSRTCGSIVPCCLGALSQRLASAYSVTELIDRFTLLPLYEPFLSDATYSAACITMAGSDGTGLKMALGITASGFLKYASLRYCPSCVREDTQHCGVAYWHRIHQALGTCICPHHAEVLRAVSFPDGGDWRCMLLPAEAEGKPMMETSGETAAGAIAEMQLWGLSHPTEVKALLAESVLKRRLDEMGFIKFGRISELGLRSFLVPRLQFSPHTNEFEQLAHSCDWVFRALRPRGTSLQPLKFYFLCWLLGLDVEKLRFFSIQGDLSAKGVSKSHNRKTAVSEAEIEVQRAAFSSSSDLKCHERPGYYWLHRHDRDWLTRYVASHPILRRRLGLIDWEVRDLTLARELEIASAQILSIQGKPQKITPTALSRRVARGHDFLKTPDKYPMSINLMNDLLESGHDYQVRKIRWATKHYSLPYHCAISVVLRYAGIRKSYVTGAEIHDILSTI